ncbi:MAG: hypothetical protein WCT77_14030, partial [Bacteroidota bacterium]
PADEACATVYHEPGVISKVDFSYNASAKVNNKTVSFAYADKSVLNAMAYDLNLISIETSKNEVSANDVLGIKVKFENGIVPVDSSNLRIFAVTGRSDTILVAEKMITGLAVADRNEFDCNFTIPDSAQFIEFFAQLDNANRINEFCELNNIKNIIIPFKGPNWILDVKNIPNPFEYRTSFSYVLPREMKKIDVTIYSMDSRIIHKIENCPNTTGVHEVSWYAPYITKGNYIYSITGTNLSGGEEKYFGKISKDK